MLKALFRPAIQSAALLVGNQTKFISNQIVRNFSQFLIRPTSNIQLPSILQQPSFLSNPALIQMPQVTQTRGLIKFSLRKGKRKTVKAVIKRFKHLDWGIWIRTIAGRKKRQWKKSQFQRYRSRQHVFVNATQSTLLDKMTSKNWKKPKHWINDYYEPYQSRENYWITRKKPIEWD